MFEKTDIRGNIITVFNKKNVKNYLDKKLFNEKNTIVEVFDTLDEAKEYAENTINYTFIAYTRDILGMEN